MILETPFYKLMKDVWDDKFVNVCTWEVVCEWLWTISNDYME